jgi:hypothetical protein
MVRLLHNASAGATQVSPIGDWSIHKTELSSYLLSLARESSLNAFFGVTYLADFNSAKS